MTSRKTVKRAKTVAEKLAAAKRAQDTYTLYMPGPLRAEWNRLKAEFDIENAKTTTGMLNEGAAKRKLAERMAELEVQMREDAIDLTVQALRRQRTPATPEDEKTWDELCAEHPPRKGDDGKIHQHDHTGVNMETFPEALVRASVVDPELTAEQWDQLLYELMTDAQYDGLFQVAWRLNRAPVDVPFSFAASKILNSGGESNKPNGSGSPRNASQGGSPAK